MKKTILISAVAASFLVANDADLGTISVSENGVSQKIENVSGEDLKSADLAEALSKNSSSVNLIRRSGIANDVLVRSQKKDNIVVVIDDAKVCGACPNRMDPPTSHIVTNNVEDIEVIGGPFDVENMGTLSGQVKIKTKDPKAGVNGDINLNKGSYGYSKLSANVSGGDEKIRVLVGSSYENSDQYEDGSGNTMAEQLENKLGTSAANARYATQYKNMESFTKKTNTLKLFVNPTENSEIRFGYTANRSDDILYPSSTMDAIYDDSDIYTLGATIKNIGDYSDALKIEAYKSTVEHLMSTKYRANATATSYMDAYVESEIKGIKLKNSFDINDSKIDIGLDTSDRNWNGNKYHSLTGYTLATTDRYFMPDVDTKNKAIFAKSTTQIGDMEIAMGVRYDNTNVKANEVAKSMSATADRDIDYKSLSANILATYALNDSLDIFAGIGQSARVPDAKELYMGGFNKADGDVKQTKNREIDVGFDYTGNSNGAKTKLFYSDLKDYIYYHSANQEYVNVDAKIYGIEVSAYQYINDEISMDLMASWQRGKKDNALAGQTDKDLADIVPLKTNIGINYEKSAHNLRLELVAAKNWSNYDEDNGEQAMAGYGVLNAKYNYKVSKNFDMTFGMDNIFDKTYAVSNTYKDLTLAGTSDGIMMLNEPGRYTYANLRYKF
ncbi:MAG: TonB-dependent receptor [Arcobacteraceae bacterium]|jgi:iron complex outermembrane receptor protein|nr:TonB-dependent receptor [Arcobacteraceae bacterium]